MLPSNAPQPAAHAAAPAAQQPTDWTSIGQLVLGILTFVLSLLAGGLFGVFGLSMVFSETGQGFEATAILGIAWVALFLAALSVPSIVYSLRRLLGKAPTAPSPARANGLRTASIALVVWPLLILVGMLISQETTLAWLVLPPLQLLVIAIPTWWLVELLRRGLPKTSAQRDWGMVNFSVFLTTPLLMIVEILAFGALLALFILWVSTRPDVLAQIERVAEQLVFAPTDPEAILEIFQPYLSNPWVILGTLGLAAGLVPLIEELMKPLAVLLLAGRRPTPAEGFIAGALSGAAFGLVESLLYLTNPTGDGWAGLAAGRTGTVLLHTATTALVGWALAEALNGRGYMRLLGTYFVAAILHGLWNGFAILAGFGVAIRSTPGSLPLFNGLATIAPAGIVLLGAALFGVLLWSNRRLRWQSENAAQQVSANSEPRSDQI